ncbi:MAG: aminopeptidase N, partial [Myxococcota bacterium]
GNRVTCRDWFQLSLKEGFTVFRDQEFSADVGSRAVKRIEDVLRLRAAQFPEDAGPTAHPVRPDSYVEISNFYTVTIYEKGAEVVRMYHTLLGEELFRRGCDLYFERHDGQAVTTDDFAAAMAEVSGRDLTQFKLWYTQAGTPVVRAHGHLDAATQTYTLELSQTVPATPGQAEKSPMLIPVVVALLDADGREVPLRLKGASDAATERTLELTEAQQTFVFEDIRGPVVPSLLRGFSAPVKLQATLSDDDLTFLMAHDTDSFNRFEASQVLATRILLDLVRHAQDGALHTAPAPEAYLSAFGQALADEGADPALLSLALALPSESVIGDALTVVDVDAVWAARQHLRRQVAAAHEGLLRARYAALAVSGPYQFTPDHVGRRALRNLCLAYLSCLDGEQPWQQAVHHLENADNMTDTMAALACLTDIEGEPRERALSDFYARFRTEPLVVDKWFALQAMSHLPGTLDRVKALLSHEAFSMENPNKVRALVASFAMGNPLRFHSKDGSGYRFLADRVMQLDAFNPQIAARILTPLARWRRQDEARQALMKTELQRVLDREGVSRDVFEIASKALAP